MPIGREPFSAESPEVAAHIELHNHISRIESTRLIDPSDADDVRKLREALEKGTGVVVSVNGKPVEHLVESTRPFIDVGNHLEAWRILRSVARGPQLNTKIREVTADARLPGKRVIKDRLF